MARVSLNAARSEFNSSGVRLPYFLCRSMAIASLAAATLYSWAISFSVLIHTSMAKMMGKRDTRIS